MPRRAWDFKNYHITLLVPGRPAGLGLGLGLSSQPTRRRRRVGEGHSGRPGRPGRPEIRRRRRVGGGGGGRDTVAGPARPAEPVRILKNYYINFLVYLRIWKIHYINFLAYLRILKTYYINFWRTSEFQRITTSTSGNFEQNIRIPFVFYPQGPTFAGASRR